MRLDHLLQRIQGLEDLPRLFAALGHEPLWEEWHEPALPLGGAPGSRVATVGRYGGFSWLAFETGTPARCARANAQRLNRQGRCSGVVALYPGGRELAIASAFDPDAVLVINLAQPAAAGTASLARLGTPAGTTLAFAALAAEALAGEPIGRRFFRRFGDTLGRMAETLPEPIPTEQRHALTLIQLTRVLFLYFLQSKGWLDGRSDFIARAVDDVLARRRLIQRDLLRPLFFGTLNRPAEERGRAASRLGSIPFLNGGLFEPHPLERRWKTDFPNPVWRDAFDSLFERFHFTVAEETAMGGVAPDMLGRVFEGVMEPGERRSSGTFYTPASLVRRLVDAALAAALASRLRCTDAEAFERLITGEAQAIAAVKLFRVLDPAVGSGAFLLGALERLAQLRPQDRPAAVKRDILRRSLFGVDRNAMAVRLTELRLWLAVIAAEPDGRARDVAPLPNLDCLVRQGDSLADPLSGGGVTRSEARVIGQLRQEAVAASGGDKTRLLRALRAAERNAADRSLTRADGRISREIAELIGTARAPTLFGGKPAVGPDVFERLRHLRRARCAIRTGRRRLATEGELPWFDYESQFPDVLARGGFDIVIGNPPWVRAESLPAAVRERLAARYRWWRGSRGRGFAHRPDLAIAFIERAHELVAPGGAVALLVPSKVAAAGYGAAVRSALAAGTQLHAVVDLSADPDAAFEATAYPMAVVLSKRASPTGHRIRTVLDPRAPGDIAQRELGEGPWIIRGRQAAHVARDIRAAHPLLSDRFVCHLGVKTGADDLFLDPPAEIERGLLRWAIRGRDIAAFRVMARRRLLWTHDARGEPLARLPHAAARYLSRHEGRLRARADFVRGPSWTVFRVAAGVERHRVAWPDLSRGLVAVALAGPSGAVVPLNTCYVAITANDSESHALAAWLNCTWVRALAGLIAMPAAGGFARHGTGTVGALPLPLAAIADPRLAALGARAGTGEALQDEIDELTAGALGLTPQERSVLASVVGPDDRR